ncbi:hypothetical protein BVRB_6g145720 [Beta vulgaris subsp. vulgaris]|nr:hypothetical protein BVRB_6g145720 [Beta vulgaris subsp. vulgaris]
MVNDDIDYDENGSDLEDVEVREARDRIKHYKKLENELEEDLDYLKRVAARRGNDKLNVGSDVEASDSSGFNSTYEESDEDDVGFLVPPPSNKSSKVQPLRGGVAVYNDNEGHNTLHSITSNHESVPNMSQSNNTRAPWFSASTSKYYYQGGGLDYNI